MVRTIDQGTVRGELIAVAPDTVHVLSDTGFVSVARRAVVDAIVVKYDPSSGVLAAWAVAGGIATLSNGGFLIFTAPAWAIAGPLAVRAENKASRIEIPPEAWETARPHARFPHGLPPGLEQAALRPKAPRTRER